MSAPIVIRDVTVITGDAAGTVLHASAVAIAGGRIAALGPSDELCRRFAGAETIDGRGHAVAPGFANGHVHLPRVLARGLFEDQNQPNSPPYSRKGFQSFPRMTAEERDAMVRLSLLEAIRSGTTLLMEVGSALADYGDIIASAGLRAVLAEQFADRAQGERVGEPGRINFAAHDADKVSQTLSRLHERFHGSHDGRLRIAIAAHAPDMCSPALFATLMRLSQTHDIISTVHLNQYWGEVDAIKATFGCLPTEHLARLGYFDRRVVAVHCRCMSEAEEAVLGAKGVTVCYTPAVTARAGNTAQIGALAAAGCRIILGSDEFAADMVEVMRLALLLERVRCGDSQAPLPALAWHWATGAGYAALGWDEGGVLRAGALADLIMIDIRKAHLAPTVRIGSGFLHQGQASDITGVMVDGNWLMKDGRVRVFDEHSVLADAERLGRQAWRRTFGQDAGPPAGIDV